MTEREARGIITDYYLSESHTEEDKRYFEEAHYFLINKYHDPNDLHNLACHYAEERNFGLYKKYLEMAADMNFFPAYEGLGYVWYYGQTGTVDYEKAFYYFSKGAECRDDCIRIGCEYKIADMYHNGYFVGKNETKYRAMIERLYDEISHPENLFSIVSPEFLPDPGLSYRLAGIRAAEGRIKEAVNLLNDAKFRFAEFLRSNPSWWGNIEEMESVIMLKHELSLEWDDSIDLYDLFWLSKDECTLSFVYNKVRFKIECIAENRNIVIRFNNKWYRTLQDFFEKAKIGGRPVTAIYDELIEYEVA